MDPLGIMSVKLYFVLYRDVSPPLLITTSVSANPPMDETRKTTGPQTRAKTTAAAAQHDGKDMELTETVAKSPRKAINVTTDTKTTDSDNSVPKTITSYYSLRSGAKSAGVFYHVYIVGTSTLGIFN